MDIQSSKVARTGMILAVALGLGAPAMLAQTSPAAQQQQEQNGEAFERSFSMNAGGTLVVENRKGTIHVTGSDTNQVVVNVRKIFEGGSDKDRQEWMAATNIEFDGNRPDMAISSIDGDIRISSNRSTIAIKSTSGAIRIETNRGDVKLWDVAIKGRLELTSNRADAVIEAKSLSGDTDLETERGSIVMRMPSTVGVNLDYQGGRRASFHCDFPVTTNENGAELNDVRGRVDRDGARISGAVNQGGARMMLRTTRGSISLEKAS